MLSEAYCWNILRERRCLSRGKPRSGYLSDGDKDSAFKDIKEFKKEMDRYIKTIKESAKTQNVKEILMPGEPEYRTESERLKQGIPLESTTLQELVALGKSLGISLPIFG
jgi:hypothetical protein